MLFRSVVHLVDARHRPTKHDHRMMDYLAEAGLPTLVVLTKKDKLGRSERGRSVARALEDLHLDESQLLPFSSKTGEGREALLEALEALIDSDRDDSEGAS